MKNPKDKLTDLYHIRWKWLPQLIRKITNRNRIKSREFIYYGRLIKLKRVRLYVSKIIIYDNERIKQNNNKNERIKIAEFTYHTRKKYVNLLYYKVNYIRKLILNAIAANCGIDNIKVKDTHLQKEEQIINKYIKDNVIKQNNYKVIKAKQEIQFLKNCGDITQENIEKYVNCVGKKYNKNETNLF